MFLESRIIAVSANVFFLLYPTINKVYLILSYRLRYYQTSAKDVLQLDKGSKYRYSNNYG